MKLHFILIAILFLLPSAILAQNVGIGNTTPAATLAVGNNSQLRVNSTGNLTRINDIPYSFPASQSTGQHYLMNDGTGGLTWSAKSRDVVRVFTVVNSGFSAWAIDSNSDYVSGSNLNPNLVLCRGLTYQFNINASTHPFVISTAQSTGTFNVGVSANAVQVGTIIFTVPMDAPPSLFYYCQVHNGTMRGTITVL